MRYLSVCSGIEAATVAWHDLGFEPLAFAEVDPFPSAVLAHHYPDVPNLGDMTQIDGRQFRGSCDLLVGGTPCQSFSVAGLRGGLEDARGNLALHFMRLAHEARPRFVLWENVPGALSSNRGRDFGAIVGALEELGYGWAYRTLDAQYFGLAQRRKRVFLVGCLGDPARASAVLFEREGLRGDSAPSREAGEDAPAGTRGGAPIAHALNGRGGAGRFDAESETLIPKVLSGYAVRRLTPRECERLQGFPDGYTRIPWKRKVAEDCPDGPRYKALGNSMAVTVMRWIGRKMLD
jgi:DNA (cytosine-5)-methyltransferase 1